MWIFLRSGDLPVSQPRVQPRVRHQELLIGAATSSVKQYYLTDVSTPDMHESLGNEARRALVSFRDMHESLGNEARRALVSFPDMHESLGIEARITLVSFPDRAPEELKPDADVYIPATTFNHHHTENVPFLFQLLRLWPADSVCSSAGKSL